MQQLHTGSSAAFPGSRKQEGELLRTGTSGYSTGTGGWQRLRQSTGQDECSLRSKVKAVGMLIGNTSLLPQLPQL